MHAGWLVAIRQGSSVESKHCVLLQSSNTDTNGISLHSRKFTFWNFLRCHWGSWLQRSQTKKDINVASDTQYIYVCKEATTMHVQRNIGQITSTKGNLERLHMATAPTWHSLSGWRPHSWRAYAVHNTVGPCTRSTSQTNTCIGSTYMLLSSKK